MLVKGAQGANFTKMQTKLSQELYISELSSLYVQLFFVDNIDIQLPVDKQLQCEHIDY